MTGSKMYFLQKDMYMSLEDISSYVKEFNDSTGLVPTKIRLSNSRYYDLVRTMHGQQVFVTSPNGQRPSQFVLTIMGYLPIDNALDDKQHPFGFLVVEDENFDKDFEDIVLKK